MNPNDCANCEGWTCAKCTHKRAGELTDTELLEIDRRVAAAVKAEREECALQGAEAMRALGFEPEDACTVRDAIRARGAA